MTDTISPNQLDWACRLSKEEGRLDGVNEVFAKIKDYISKDDYRGLVEIVCAEMKVERCVSCSLFMDSVNSCGYCGACEHASQQMDYYFDNYEG